MNQPLSPARFPAKSRRAALAAMGLAGIAFASAVFAQSAGVGLTGEIKEVFLPGGELRVKPDPAGRSPLAVRITAAYPHGTAGYRYDFAWVAYESGQHDIARYLERVDGSPAGDLPPVLAEAAGILPPGPPGGLAEFSAPAPSLGGYRTALITTGCLWAAGLIGLLCWRRQKSEPAETAVAADLPLGDRLRALLERARSGSLDANHRAELERLVLGFWRERLDLTRLPVPEAIRRLRDHPEAGGLLRQVEEWLHSGKSPTRETEIASLLTPYLNPVQEPVLSKQ